MEIECTKGSKHYRPLPRCTFTKTEQKKEDDVKYKMQCLLAVILNFSDCNHA